MGKLSGERKCKRQKVNEAPCIPTVLETETLVFCSQIPPSFLKHSAEVLLRIAPRCVITVDGHNLSLTAADITSPVHISVQISTHLLQCAVPCQTTTTKSIDSSELLMVTKSLRKKDNVFLYCTDTNTIGIVTENANHIKNSLLNACISPKITIVTAPKLPHTVHIKSAVFQRMLRDYRSTTKKIKISGNDTYVMFEIEQSDSLHRTDKIKSIILYFSFYFFHLSQTKLPCFAEYQLVAPFFF